MNMQMQAMMKQAQQLQNKMLQTKKEIDETEFTGESSLVKVTVLGTKEVTKVEINSEESLGKDDLEMLQDMIMVAVNEANKKVDAEVESKMSQYGNIPGLF